MVRVSEGLLAGDVVQNEYGGMYMYLSFKGIPYAQPPVGELRFKPPQPIEVWKEIINAKNFGPVSYQYNVLNPKQENMSEDCLYLNVYTPDTKPKQLLPVMIWIHGGGFTCGSGNDDVYGPQFLIRHGVVLVTLNYRLEALGFLCLDTADIPGNAGMKDQVAAMRWVKKNIANFGGDPENITIFGESAGAASVSYHLVSPMTKGLFRRAITQSGAATCKWSQYFEPRDKALLLARQLGCTSEDDKELYEFFKKQRPEKLIKLNLRLYKSQKLYEIHFGVADEKDFGQERFFYGDITDALRNGIHEGVEVLTGYTKDEGLLAIALGNPLDRIITEAKHSLEFFIPDFINIHCIFADQLKAARKMRKFYFSNGDISEENVLKFISTDMFRYGITLSAKLYSKKNKVYLYKFNCVSERNFFGHCFGLTEVIKNKPVVCHCDDLGYLFPTKLVKGKVVQPEILKLIDQVTTLWTNFAKFGNPTPDNNLGVEWKPYTIEGQDYLDIGNQLSAGTAPDKEELEFWESVYKEVLPKYTA